MSRVYFEDRHRRMMKYHKINVIESDSEKKRRQNLQKEPWQKEMDRFKSFKEVVNLCEMSEKDKILLAGLCPSEDEEFEQIVEEEQRRFQEQQMSIDQYE